jgi:phage terminase large subunit
MMYLIARAQNDKVPTITSVVSESVPHLKRGAIRDFTTIMETHGYYRDDLWNRTDSIYKFETGSILEFFSADQSDKLRGGRRDRLFINEANNVSFQAFEELEVRTRDFAIIDYNPTNEFWYFTDVKPYRTDLEELILTYKDNEALDANTVLSIEQRRDRKDWWQVYGLGLLGVLEGRIYKNWAIIDEIPHEARLERYGIDFGFSNDPAVIVAIYYYNGGYIFDEVLFQKGLSNKQLADTLLNLPPALVVADSAEPKSIAELSSYGINILPAVKGKDSANHGIQFIQGQRISITKSSLNGIKAYRNYMWQTDSDGKNLTKPDHFYSDFHDACRYAMSTLNTELMPHLKNKMTAQFSRNRAAFYQNSNK